MTTRIILVRHGETDWNKQGRYQGQIDTNLSEWGKEQARLLGIGAKDFVLNAAYSSPLGRAYETAKAVTEYHNLSVEVLEGLSEISHGKWEGLLSEEVYKEWPDLVELWQTHPHEVLMPEGEDLKGVQQRAMEAIYRIVEGHPNETVLVASHDATNKAIICGILGIDLKNFWQIKQDNTCINVLEYDNGKWRVCLLNDTCHLGQKVSMVEQKAL